MPFTYENTGVDLASASYVGLYTVTGDQTIIRQIRIANESGSGTDTGFIQILDEGANAKFMGSVVVEDGGEGKEVSYRNIHLDTGDVIQGKSTGGFALDVWISFSNFV